MLACQVILVWDYLFPWVAGNSKHSVYFGFVNEDPGNIEVCRLQAQLFLLEGGVWIMGPSRRESLIKQHRLFSAELEIVELELPCLPLEIRIDPGNSIEQV